MIKTVALEKIFRTEEVETLALNKVSIEVKEGEFVLKRWFFVLKLLSD